VVRHRTGLSICGVAQYSSIMATTLTTHTDDELRGELQRRAPVESKADALKGGALAMRTRKARRTPFAFPGLGSQVEWVASSTCEA